MQRLRLYRHQTVRSILVLVIALLALAACGDDAETSGSTTSLPATTTVPPTTSPPTTVAPTTTTTVPPTTTMPPSGEPPEITLAGWTTVYSPDGNLVIEGWLDQPGTVTIGDVPADVYDDPYAGTTTFIAEMALPAGEHALEVKAVGASGAENSIYLGVLVDPALDVQIGYLWDLDLIDRKLDIDYVEFLTGDEANAAAIADGVIAEGEELPNGFYVRNQDPSLQTVNLGDPGVIVLQACFPDPGPCVTRQPVGIDLWAKMLSNPEAGTGQLEWSWYGGGQLPYWFTIQDGYVIQIQEQYLP